MRGCRRALCTCDTLSAAPFAGTGAKTRIDIVDTGAHDSDSAPAYARREPSQSRSEARCVRLARSSCAVASSSQAAQGHPAKAGRDNRGRPSLGYLSWPRKKGNQPPGCPRPSEASSRVRKKLAVMASRSLTGPNLPHQSGISGSTRFANCASDSCQPR